MEDLVLIYSWVSPLLDQDFSHCAGGLDDTTRALRLVARLKAAIRCAVTHAAVTRTNTHVSLLVTTSFTTFSKLVYNSNYLLSTYVHEIVSRVKLNEPIFVEIEKPVTRAGLEFDRV